MAPEQDIGDIPEKLSKIANKSDEALSQVLGALQSLQLRLEAPEDLNLRLLNLQHQLTATQIGQDPNVFQKKQQTRLPRNPFQSTGPALSDSARSRGASRPFGRPCRSRPGLRVPWFTVFPLAVELGTDASALPGGSSQDDIAALVDVGGGFGHQCAALAAAFPALRGRIVLQDMAQTLAIAPPLRGMRATEHDFFAQQPVRGARFYFLRNVLHDWPDDKAVAISSIGRRATSGTSHSFQGLKSS